MFKSVAGNIIAKNIISIIGAGYIYLVYITSKIKLHNRTNIEKILGKRESFIYAFWHDQLLMCPLTWKNESKIMVLISKHRDGDIISKVISYLGFSAIRGSTSKPTKIKSKGGILAARKMLKSLENGSSVGIALDGPRGPRHQVSEGPIQIARISNKMIFELKSNVMVDGITAKLIIWIAEIASVYSGKIIGMMKGANDMLNMVIIMDENNVKILIFVVDSPIESCGSVYR